MKFVVKKIFPRGWKCSQWHFSFFQGVGNTIFCVFGLSKGLEMQPVAFFVLPRGWKRNFPRFWAFQGVGNAPDCIFHSSKGLETQFSVFFVLPRGWRHSRHDFLFFPTLGRLFLWLITRGLILDERADAPGNVDTTITS